MTSDNHVLLIGSPGWYTGAFCAHPRPVWMRMHTTHCESWKRASKQKNSNGIGLTSVNTRDGGCILPPLILCGVKPWDSMHDEPYDTKYIDLQTTHARHHMQGPQLSGRWMRRMQMWGNIQDTKKNYNHECNVQVICNVGETSSSGWRLRGRSRLTNKDWV